MWGQEQGTEKRGTMASEYVIESKKNRQKMRHYREIGEGEKRIKDSSKQKFKAESQRRDPYGNPYILCPAQMLKSRVKSMDRVGEKRLE